MENKENKSKTTNAERSKRHRDRNLEQYRKKDAVRKKHSRLILKTNKTANGEYKRQEMERKRTTKMRKNILIYYYQQSEEPLRPSTFFGNATIISISVNETEKSLPNSPSRKREVITRLASIYQVRVNFGGKVERKKNAFSEEEFDWVIAFLNQPDISYITPGRKDNLSVGTFNKVRKFPQKQYLLWIIREILEIINSSKLLQSSEPNRKLHVQS